MTNGTIRRGVILGALLMSFAALAVVFGLDGRHTPRAEAAGGTVDLSMAIDVGGGGDDCDTRASTPSIGTTCTVPVGTQFTMRGNIDKVAGLPGTGGYIVFQFRFLYTSPGLTRNNRTTPAEVGTPPFWGLPCSPNNENDMPGNYYVDCWGPGTKSMYTGKLVEVDFTCASAGTRTITMNDASSYVHDQNHGQGPDAEGDETLTINCTEAPVGGIAELPGVAGAPLEERAEGAGMALWLVAALASAAAIAASGATWFAWRRWHQ